MVDVIDLTKIAESDIKVDGVPVQKVEYGKSPVYPSRPHITSDVGTSVKGLTHIEDALTKANLNYRVVQVPLYRSLKGEMVPIKGRMGNVRDDTGEFIEVVSNRYTPFQNYQAYAFLESALQSGALELQNAGQFNYGSVFIEAKTPKNITVLGDEFYPYALIRNSHDKTTGVQVCFTFTRVICENTLAMAIAGAPRIWQAKHLRSIEGRMEEIAQMMQVMHKYTEGYPVVAEKMNSINLSEDDITRVLKKMFPLKEEATKKAVNNVVHDVKEILHIYNDTPDLKKFHGTAWGFFNAIGDFVTHTAPGRETANWKANRLDTIANGHPIVEIAQRELLAVAA